LRGVLSLFGLSNHMRGDRGSGIWARVGDDLSLCGLLIVN
jgi:hypothetical protein